MAKIDLIGPGYVGRSKNVNASRCVNFYPEVNSQDSKSIVSLIGTPGTQYFTNAADGIIRGMHTFNGLIYLVSGNKLYSVDPNGVRSSQLGETLQTSLGRVVFSNNGLAPTGGNQLIISDGTKLYCYNVSTTVFTTIDIAAYTTCFIGGYFVSDIGSSGGGRFRVSNLLDGSVWDSLDFATAESSPDELLTVSNNHGELWLFGDYTTEIFYQKDSGSPPFARASGGVIDYGCAARYSVAQGSNTIIWLGNKRNDNQGQFSGVYMADGYGARLISPQSINYTIDNYSVISDAFAYFYTEEGHEFYVLTFPTSNATWVYDTTTGYWHERSTYKNDPYKVGRHIGNCYCHFNNKHYVGDYNSSNILEMRSDVYKDLTDSIVSFRTTNHIYDADDLNNLFIHRLQLDIETGVPFSVTDKYYYDTKTSDLSTWTYDACNYGDYIYVTDFTNNNVLKLDGSGLNVIKTIPVGTNPFTIEYIDNYFWISNNGAGTISKIDPITDTVVATIAVGTAPRKVIKGGNYIWVPNTGSNNVTQIDPTTHATVTVSLLGAQSPIRLLYNDGYVWVLSLVSPAEVDKIDVTSATSVATYNYGIATKDMIVYGGFLYLYLGWDSEVIKIDPSDGSELSSAAVDANLNTRVVGSSLFEISGFLWLLNEQIGKLETINLSTMVKSSELDLNIAASPDPRAFKYAFGYLWVMGNGGNQIIQVDPATNKIVGKYSNINDCRLISYNDNSVYFPGTDTFFKINIIEKEPQISLSWSSDSGNTWSNEITRSSGALGKYKKRSIWNRLGRAVNKTFRIAISSPIKKVLLGAYINATKGNN